MDMDTLPTPGKGQCERCAVVIRNNRRLSHSGLRGPLLLRFQCVPRLRRRLRQHPVINRK